MGSAHGLSPLQRTILVLAYHNWEREGRTTRSEGCDCYYYEVLARVWGFENRWAHLTHRTPERWHFRHRQIPYHRYNTAQASLSRAVRRLAHRGLVTRHRSMGWRGAWAGVKLTATGLPVATRVWEAWLARQVLARLQAAQGTK